MAGVDATLDLLEPLYRDHPGWPAERAAIAGLIAAAAARRPPELRALDAARSADPAWFGAPGTVGYSFYVDRFAVDLAGVPARLPWLESLGVKLLHPLPMFRAQAGDSDGGFAVADYCAVDPALGTVDDVRALAADLHARGMALAIDCVLNHSARDHPWAQAALGGDGDKLAYYHPVANAEEVAAWEASLDQVFPVTAPGNFTWEPKLEAWVWTSFYPYQWDLNWANPAVFREMLAVLLFWAEIGVDAFRLDSAPYLWKRQGTSCRNLPETHRLVAALRAALDVAAPGVVLIAEAIERTADVLPYLGSADGSRAAQLAYHNGLMAALWSALATGDPGPVAELLAGAPLHRSDVAWLTYLRCHDDIIWSALSDVMSPAMLEKVSRHYTGEGGSQAGGRRFQTAPGAVSSTVGMLATLVGGDGALPLARYRLLLATMLAFPGMPMLYMGDEIALPDAQADTAALDARWLHRPPMNWPRAEAAAEGSGAAANWLATTRQLLATRAATAVFHAAAPSRVLPAPPGLLLLERGIGSEAVLVVANFTGEPQPLEQLTGRFTGAIDLLEGETVGRSIKPLGTLWLSVSAR